MESYVYVLWSEKLGKRYIGSCRDLKSRIQAHNTGKQRFTKAGIPWELIYKEERNSYSEARQREAFLKSGQGRLWLDRLME
jgi:putative endonuclease